MTHKLKLKMARKMMTAEERKHHCPVFSSRAWAERREGRLRKQAIKHLMAAERKERKRKEKGL